MAIKEQTRRQVFERDADRCQLFHRVPVDATEIAHVHHQGMGGRPTDAEENQPENLISACAECHRKLHGTGIPYQIVRWMPGDSDGLEVVDPEGRRVPHGSLWYYAKREMSGLVSRIQRVGDLIRSIRAAQWELGGELAWLKGCPQLAEYGYSDVYQLSLEHGLSSAEAKRLIRAATFARDMELDCTALDPVIVDRIRRVPEEDVAEVFAEAQVLSLPHLYQLLNDRYGSERQKTYRVFTAGPVREIRAVSEDEVEYGPDELVIRGGSVIAGGREADDA